MKSFPCEMQDPTCRNNLKHSPIQKQQGNKNREISRRSVCFLVESSEYKHNHSSTQCIIHLPHYRVNISV